MKKLILLTAMAIGLSMAAKAEVKATAVTAVYTSSPQAAMTVDDNNRALFYPVIIPDLEDTDSEYTVTIFDENLSVEKQFKLPYNENMSLKYLYTRGIDLATIQVTKNFFVKNDKWCVTFRNKLSTDGRELIIIDEDGNRVGTLPSELYDGEIFLSNIIGGTPYLCVRTDGVSNYDPSYYQFYTFTGKAGVEANKVATFPKAYPNPLPAGATFTVDFNQAADNATFFTVLDMNGRQVYRSKVKPGETSFELSGARFGHGQYVYTVVYGSGEAMSGKLLAE